MRFSILKAGRAPRKSRERIGDYDRMFLDLLSAPEDQWEVHDVEQDQFPEDEAGYDGFVITGSPASAYEDLPWIRNLLELTRRAHQRKQRLLGVCFGSQIVAMALGGQVAPNTKGWDVGLTGIQLTDAGKNLPLLSGAPSPLRAYQSHQDIVTELPPGAVQLASSELTPFEMFHLENHVLCMQGHPEMDQGVVENLLDARDFLPPDIADRGRKSLSEQPHRTFLKERLRRFLEHGLKPPT